MMPISQPSRRRRVLRTLVLVALVGGLAACGRKGEIIDLVPPPPDPDPRRRSPRRRSPRYRSPRCRPIEPVPIPGRHAARRRCGFDRDRGRRSARPPTSIRPGHARAGRSVPGRVRGERVLFCYAVKANSNLAVIRLFAQAGLGADTVSGGEIARALAAGRAAAAHRLCRHRQDRRRDPDGAGDRHPAVQRRIRRRSCGGSASWRRPWGGRRRWRCGSTRTSTPARTRRSAPAASTTSSASRTTRRRPSIALAAGLTGIEPVGRASAYRLADQPARAVRGGLPARQSSCSRACEREGIPLRRLDLGGGFGVRYLDEPRIDAEALAGLVAPRDRRPRLRAAVRARPRARRRGGCPSRPR